MLLLLLLLYQGVYCPVLATIILLPPCKLPTYSMYRPEGKEKIKKKGSEIGVNAINADSMAGLLWCERTEGAKI